MPATRRVAPTDEAADAAWDRIMKEAAQHCLIVQAFGGTCTLAVPEEQRKACIRQRVLDSELAVEHERSGG